MEVYHVRKTHILILKKFALLYNYLTWSTFFKLIHKGLTREWH